MGKVSSTQILECSSGGYLGTQSWSVMNGILSKSSKIVHFSQICYTFTSCSAPMDSIPFPAFFIFIMSHNFTNVSFITHQDCVPTYPPEFLCSNLEEHSRIWVNETFSINFNRRGLIWKNTLLVLFYLIFFPTSFYASFSGNFLYYKLMLAMRDWHFGIETNEMCHTWQG